MSSSSFLSDYIPETDFARDLSVSQRTIARYRKEPDGLPFAVIGGRIHIHVPGAKQWLARRLRHPNPRREG